MISLNGKTALITGATGGMGIQIALCLAKENVNLVLLGRDMGKLVKLKDEIKSQSNIGVDFIKLDLETDIEKDVQEIIAPKLNIDILVYAAGLIIPNKIVDVKGKEFTQQFNVNFKSAYTLISKLIPQLMENKGQIVIINSSIIRNAKRDLSLYSASKHALAGFTDALRREVNSAGVRVVNVVPGKTATAMQELIALDINGEFNWDLFIQPYDIAYTVVQVLKLPYTAEITDIFIRPMIN